MKIIVIFFLIFVGNFLYPSELNNNFEDANKLYSDGEYFKAIEEYNIILEKGYKSFELYYNLGNSYYKTGDFPNAILYYERAKKIDYNDKDLNKNLEIVNNLLVDKIEEIPETLFSKIKKFFLGIFSFEQWGISSIILSFFTFLFFVLFRKSVYEAKQKIFFIFFIISLILSLTFFSISINQYNYHRNNKKVILFVPNTYIKSEPSSSANDLFILHEGTKMKVLEEYNQWLKIKLSDGKDGWLKDSDVKYI